MKAIKNTYNDFSTKVFLNKIFSLSDSQYETYVNNISKS